MFLRKTNTYIRTMDSPKSCMCDIINALRNEIVSLEQPENRELLERFIFPDAAGRTDDLFTRRTPLTAPLLLSFIMRHNPLSTQISLFEFFDSIGHHPVTKSALSQRRTRLNPEVFVYLGKNLLRRSYDMLKDKMPLWHGWHVLAADGSDIALPDTESIAEYFGRHKYATNRGTRGETFPIAKAVMVNDMLSEFTLCGTLRADRFNERTMLEDLLPELIEMLPFEPPRTICIMDRGYYSLKIVDQIIRAGMKYVIRVPFSSKVIDEFVASGEMDKEIEWMPTHNTSLSNDSRWKAEGRKPLRIRLVRVDLPEGEVEVLATNLNCTEVPTARMKELYFMRWPIEVEYLHYKHALVIESFSGGRPICIMQDYFATILVHNMIRLITTASGEEVKQENLHKKLNYKPNVAILVGMFYAVFVEMMVLDKLDWCVGFLYVTACKMLTPIREGRKFPRRWKKRANSDKNRTQSNRKRVN